MTLLLGRLLLIAGLLGLWELAASTIADESSRLRPV